MSLPDIIKEVKKYDSEYVCVTGGEPLGQRATTQLMQLLLDQKYIVSLETNGSFSVKEVPLSVIKVIDIKCPESGESERLAWENFDLVRSQDQFKFVVASKNDFEWAHALSQQHKLNEKCTLLYSPVFGKVKPAELAKWILQSKAKATLQIQMHKEIWGTDERGV